MSNYTLILEIITLMLACFTAGYHLGKDIYTNGGNDNNTTSNPQT